MYLFIIITVLIATIGTAMISYFINTQQIDNFCKTITINNAQNFVSLINPEYMQALKDMATSEEYQLLRNTAEETDDEAMVEAYLREHDMWDGYVNSRKQLMTYLNNMENVKYLYIVVCGDIICTDSQRIR
ncbi:MAG: hypothetical protein E7496_11070 [Ruminococcus sp.]|nr:hypothetical protein [Ruminococcus sp.]